MASSDFLKCFDPGTVILYFEDFAGAQTVMRDLDFTIIAQRSPLLGQAIDFGPGDKLSLTLRVPSDTCGIGLTRWLYLGSYTVEDPEENVDPNLLYHAQMIYVAETINSKELMDLATFNFAASLDDATSLATSPFDLVEATDFLYKHLENKPVLLENVLHYCVNCFTTQRLNENEEFKLFAATHPTFLSDLSKVNAARNFENRDIPKLVGPKSSRAVKTDEVICKLFNGPVAKQSRRPSISSIDSDYGLDSLFAELDVASPDPSSSPVSTDMEESFVVCGESASEESDSEWLLV
ncbi:hypothetical protein SLS56_001032 [Neofusicoccum ribis]|uniref:Uncharacterized protein n=1 Tax=Neofusicoccum ribis TaxID=45134 RepID=A0ABR3TB58_9PEZI